MRMRILFFCLTLICCLHIQADNQTDSIIGQMTLREKISKLFVDELIYSEDSSCSFHYIDHLDGINIEDTCALTRYVLDSREGAIDQLSLSLPDESTLRAITDSIFLHQYYQNLIEYCAFLGANGIIIPGDGKNSSRLMMVQNNKCDTTLAIMPFPLALFEKWYHQQESLLADGSKDNRGWQEDLPGLEVWNQLSDPLELFDKLIERPVLFSDTIEPIIFEQLFTAFEAGRLSESILNERLRLMRREKITVEDTLLRLEPLERSQLEWRSKAYRKSVSIYQNDELLPFKGLGQLTVNVRGNSLLREELFKEVISTYVPESNGNSRKQVNIYLCDSIKSKEQLSAMILQKEWDSNKKNILVGIGSHIGHLHSVADKFDAVVIMPQKIEESWSLLAQALFGGIATDGIIPNCQSLGSMLPMQTTKSRLGFHASTIEFTADSLSRIDSIINDAIRKKATPGAQLLVAHGGDVIIRKSYGHHTYKKKREVKNADLYDVASITKLAVTFPLVMHLYESGGLDLEAKLGQYLPVVDTTNKKDITIRELLLHQSGLISYIPFQYKALKKESLRDRSLFSRHYSSLYNIRVDKRLYQNKNARYRRDIFHARKDTLYSNEVSEKMFMNHHFVDSMYHYIYNSQVLRKKEYRYSDLGYYLLQKIIEQEEEQTVDQLFSGLFTSRLGAGRMCYKPLRYFPLDVVVPTEDDKAFRKELLHGYVHDQGASMMGGVAAHAGLFASAGDLAKMAQLFLNEGWYGGERYFSANTIGLFTKTAQYGNRRGLGVDKPELEPGENSHVSQRVSSESYGHTGFTGTIMWVDPENDLIYIFLSNRIHPHSYNKKLIEMNVRTKVQDVIYNTLVPKGE